MQKPSPNDAISRTAEKMHDHAQMMRVKAWRLMRENNQVDGQRLLNMANASDRALIPLLPSIDAVWNRR